MKAWELVYKLVELGLDKDVHLSEHGGTIILSPVWKIEEKNLISWDKSLKHWIYDWHRPQTKQIVEKKAIVIKV